MRRRGRTTFLYLPSSKRKLAVHRKPLSPLAEAFACVKRSGERWWEPELYRLQGTFLLQLPQPDEARAEECFQRAIAVARGQ